MGDKKRVLENSILYTFGSLMVKAMGFLLLPIYTIYLTPGDYGITGLVNGFINVGNFIIAFSLYSAIIRFYNELKDNSDKLKRFNGTIIVFTAITGLLFFVFGFVFSEMFTKSVFEGISYFPIVLLAFINLIFITLNRIHQNMLQAMQQGRKLTVINLLVFVLTAAVSLVLLIVFRLGALAIVLAQTIVFTGYVIYMLYDLKKNDLITICLDINHLKKALKYSIPLMPHNLSTHIAGLVSRIFINTSSTLAYVGLYNIGMQFAALIDIIQVAVNKAFQPWLFNELNKNEVRRQDVLVLSDVLLYCYSFIYMGIGLFSQEVVILMTDQAYTMAWTVIPILVMAFSVKSIYYFYVNLIMYNIAASRKLFIATTLGSLLNIIASYVLIQAYGMHGAAIAFLIAKVVVVILVVYMARRYNVIHYKLSKMLRIIVPSIVTMWIGLYFSYQHYPYDINIGNLTYKIAIFLTYSLTIFMLNKKIILKYDMINVIKRRVFRRG